MKNNQEQSEQSQNNQSNVELLKQLSSRITFALGALVGAGICWLFELPMAIGILFGGAGALTLTTLFAPNKSKKERYVLGGAMLVFLILAITGYAVY